MILKRCERMEVDIPRVKNPEGFREDSCIINKMTYEFFGFFLRDIGSASHHLSNKIEFKNVYLFVTKKTLSKEYLLNSTHFTEQE